MSFTARKSLGRFDVHSAKILLPEDSTVKCSLSCVLALSSIPNTDSHIHMCVNAHVHIDIG